MYGPLNNRQVSLQTCRGAFDLTETTRGIYVTRALTLPSFQVYEKVSEFFADSEFLHGIEESFASHTSLGQMENHDFLTGGTIPEGKGYFAPLTLVSVKTSRGTQATRDTV